jgi:hypothetical protein
MKPKSIRTLRWWSFEVWGKDHAKVTPRCLTLTIGPIHLSTIFIHMCRSLERFKKALRKEIMKHYVKKLNKIYKKMYD